MRFTLTTIGVCLLSFGSQAAYGQADEKTGLNLGTKAPAFTLKDQNGKDRTLGEFVKKGKVALVFYRSASW